MKVTIESHSLADLSKGVPVLREEIEVDDSPAVVPTPARRPRRTAAPEIPAEVDQDEHQEEDDAAVSRT